MCLELGLRPNPSSASGPIEPGLGQWSSLGSAEAEFKGEGDFENNLELEFPEQFRV